MTPKEKPRAFLIGSPPMFRGTLKPGRDIEMQILKNFPGTAMFLEKPITTGPLEDLQDGYKIAKALEDAMTITSVGYVPCIRFLQIDVMLTLKCSPDTCFVISRLFNR